MMTQIRILTRKASTLSTFRKTTKILRHFEEVHCYNVPEEITNLRKKVMSDLKSSQPPSKLDLFLCSQFKIFNPESYLYLMNSWASIRPDILPETVFYEAFLKKVRRGLWKTVNWNQLMQIIHFVGYMNGDQDSKSLMILFLHTVNDSSFVMHAPYKDICIVCEAAFRTSTAISSPEIRARINEILENLSDEVTDDSVWLVMLIKMMVFSKYYDRQLLENLASKWLTSGKAAKMPFTAQCYVMSLFSHAGVRHDRLFRTFTDSFALKVQRNPEMLRVKDVSMFLWSLSHLSFKLNAKFLDDVVLTYMLTQLTNRNLTDGLSILIKCSICLWMLGLSSKAVFESILTMESLHRLRDKRKNMRDLSRFALMMSILEGDCPGSLSPEQLAVKEALSKTTLLVPNIEKEVEKRPGLRVMIRALRSVGFKDVNYHYSVMIYVAGVSAVLENRNVHIDLLDPTMCLGETEMPSGIFLAKVKLFKLLFPGTCHTCVTPNYLNRNPKREEWEEKLGLARTKV